MESKVQYFTDEEELAKDTEWIVKKKHTQKEQKRKASGTPKTSPQLLTVSAVNPKPQQVVQKAPLLPPIIVVNEEKYEDIYEYIFTVWSPDHCICLNK